MSLGSGADRVAIPVTVTRGLSPSARAEIFAALREFIAIYARDPSSRFLHVPPGAWYGVLPLDRTHLLRDARSHRLTLLVDGADAEGLVAATKVAP